MLNVACAAALLGIEVAEIVTAFDESEDAGADAENEIDLTGTRNTPPAVKQNVAVTESAVASASFTKERA